MKTILKIIDAVSYRTGKTLSWLSAVLVILITLEVTLRFVFNSPTMWGFETSMMVGTTIYVIGWSYVHQQKGHIRVDVIYVNLSRRAQAAIDVIGDLVAFFPVVIIFTYAAISGAVSAWKINEKMTYTLWYPPFGPLRTLVAIAAVLLLSQGLANFIRDLHLLIRNKPYD